MLFEHCKYNLRAVCRDMMPIIFGFVIHFQIFHTLPRSVITWREVAFKIWMPKMQPIACPTQTHVKSAMERIAMHAPTSKSVTLATAKVTRYAREMPVRWILKYVNRTTATVLLESTDTVTFIVDAPSHMKLLNKNFRLCTKLAMRINATTVCIQQMHCNAINARETIRGVIWWIKIP